MILGGGREFLQLEVQERVPDALPCAGDVRVVATLQLQDFGGRYDKVWIQAPALNLFIRQLGVIVESRRGKAVLNAASPDELSVEIRSMDSLGHFEIFIQLGCVQWSGGAPRNVRLSGGFEIDSMQLLMVLEAFNALL
ncbi:MAG: hypothetical protein AB8B99_19440 [Phormidesmis sp.]